MASEHVEPINQNFRLKILQTTEINRILRT